MPAPRLSLRGISKQFGAIRANDAISLDLRAGEIHALLGENGAGKTTLLNILAGMYQPDAGQILLDGTPVQIESPAAALRLGIGTVYQHFALVPTLSILDNVMLGLDTGPLLDPRAVEKRLAPVLEAVGLSAAPGTEVRHLAIGERQRVEIARALVRGSRVLLLDEPTSVLSPPEVQHLLDILRRLRADGVAVVLITHKLDEALQVSDRVTVLRAGRVVGELSGAALAPEQRAAVEAQIVALMFGAIAPALAAPSAPPVAAAPLLELRDLSIASEHGRIAVRDLSLSLLPGEVVGIAGVDGNGQTELAEAIAGQRRVLHGEISVRGKAVTNLGVAAALAAGIGAITEDRLGEGVVPGLSVAAHVALKRIRQRPFARGIWLDRRAMEREAAELISSFDIRTPGPSTRLAQLSGGNIQKVLLARELALNPAVLLGNQPTAGLDVKTARSVLAALRAHADAGNVVLLISTELDELLAVADRIAVMAGGRIVAVLPRAEADPARIGALMLGGQTVASA